MELRSKYVVDNKVKICADCRFYRTVKHLEMHGTRAVEECAHPDLYYIDVVTGRVSLPRCSSTRLQKNQDGSPGGECGRYAVLFEPRKSKDKKLGWFSQLRFW